MAGHWEDAVKSAMKILGDKGKIPKPGSVQQKASVADKKALDEFKKSRDDLKSKLLALQNAAESHKNAISQFQDEIDADDFGLNLKDKDDAKKITEAKKLLSGFVQVQIDGFDQAFKDMKELDKHLMSFSNYKR